MSTGRSHANRDVSDQQDLTTRTVEHRHGLSLLQMLDGIET
jgi:hypothetical protein